MLKSLRIYLNLGSKCNMNCKYCFQSNQNENNTIKKQVVDKVIEFINNTPQRKINLAFWGGEPTLYLDIIDYVVKNTHKHKNIIYDIATNGTNNILLQKIIDKYEDSRFNILLSNKNNNDINTWDKLKMVSKFNLILSPYTICTLSKEYIDSLICQNNIKSIVAIPDYVSDWSIVDEKQENNFIEIINYINTKMYINNKIILMYINCVNDNNFSICPRNEFNIDMNGDVYLCHRFMNDKDKQGKLVIGNILKEDIVNLYNKNIIERNKLQNNLGCCYFENSDRNKKSFSKLLGMLHRTNIDFEGLQHIDYMADRSELDRNIIMPLC